MVAFFRRAKELAFHAELFKSESVFLVKLFLWYPYFQHIWNFWSFCWIILDFLFPQVGHHCCWVILFLPRWKDGSIPESAASVLIVLLRFCSFITSQLWLMKEEKEVGVGGREQFSWSSYQMVPSLTNFSGICDWQ